MIEEAVIEDIPQVGEQGPGDPPKLKEEHLLKLDSIVQKMIANKESDDDIRMVVNDFKKIYTKPVQSAPKPEPVKPFNWQAAPFTTVPLPEREDEPAVSEFDQEVRGAANRIQRLDFKPEIKNLLTKNKRESELQQTLTQLPAEGMPTDPAVLKQIHNLLPKSGDVSEDEVNSVMADLPNNPGLAKEAAHEMAKKDPTVKADMYRLSAASRSDNAKKIAKNAKAIEEGDLDFDPRSGRLTKPLNVVEAAASGWGERKRLLKGYEAMDGKSDEEKIAYLKGDVPKRRDEDDPIPDTNSPAGFLGETVGSEGVPMSKSLIAGGAVQALGSLVPGIGNAATSGLSAAAAAAASSPEYFKRSYYGTLQNEFHALTEQGMPEKEALAEAEHRAKVGAIADVAANGAMNFVGVRSGLKPAKFGSEYMGVVKKLSKSGKDFIKESIPEAAGVGAIGAGAQAVKNIDKGADASEGIDEAFLHNAAFVVGIKSLTRAGSTLFNKVKDAAIAKENIIKQPDEIIHQKVGEMLQDGSITPEEANEALANIAAAKQEDAVIPPHVKDEGARIELKSKIAEYNTNKNKLEALHESFHPKLKERNKQLEWDINMLQETPENQVKILNAKKQELEGEIAAHDEAKKDGKPGKLEDRAAVKKQLTEVEGRLNDVTKKIDEPIYKAQKIIDEDIKDDYADWTKNDMYRRQAAEDPNEFLKFIAEQAQGELDGASSRPVTERTFGKGLVKAAEEMFPKPEPSRISVIEPKAEGTPETKIVTIAPKENIAPANTEFSGGEPPIERTVTPKAEEPEPGTTNIKHATLKADAESRELGVLAEKTDRTFQEISAKADELIRKGETANIIDAVKKGEGITTDQKAVLIKTKSAIDKEYDKVSKEYDDAVLSGNEDLIKAAEEKKTEVGNQALDIYNVAKKAGSEAGLSLVTQKINAEADYSIGEMLSRKQEAKVGKRMSKEERDNVEKQHKSMTEKEKKIKDKGKQMADAIRKLRINKGDNLQSNILAIPVAVWDGAVTTVANAVELGANLADAINEGVKHIKDNGGFKNKGDERKFRNHILNAGKEPDRLANFKSRTKSAIEGVKEKIANKDFEKAEKTPLELDKEAMDLRVELQDTRHQFDVEVLKDEMDKENWYQRNITKNIRKGIGTIKAVTSGIDDSAVAIQNYLAILANPKIAASSLKEHALDAFSQKRFDRQLAALHNSEHWELMKESGLDVLEPQSVHESLKEELMANSFHNDEINIKLKGKKTNINPAQVLKPFERAFTSLGNNIRTKLFLQQAETLLSEGKTFRTHPEEFKSLARVINEITARGKQNKYIELANPVVTAAIWSPKLLASGFNALGISDLVSFLPGAKTLGTEGFYRKLTPRQRKFALAQVGKGLSIGISVMTAAGIAKSMGADVDVDYDPRSVTFGEIRRGNKSVNVFGRFSPIIKVLVQSTLSKRLKNGKEQDLDSGDYGKKNVGGLVGSFFRGKMTPIAGLVYDYKLNAKKHFFTNEEMTMANTLKQLGPISLQGLGKGLERDGSLYLLNDFLPNFVGLNVKDKRDFEKQKKSGKPTRPKSPKAPKKPE